MKLKDILLALLGSTIITYLYYSWKINTAQWKLDVYCPYKYPFIDIFCFYRWDYILRTFLLIFSILLMLIWIIKRAARRRPLE